MTGARQGTVQSHTVIRVPGKAHAADAPFILLLVRLDDGKSVLGHFNGNEPPAIDARVTATGTGPDTLKFAIPGDTA